MRWFVEERASRFTVREETIGAFQIIDALKPEPLGPSDARSAVFY